MFYLLPHVYTDDQKKRPRLGAQVKISLPDKIPDVHWPANRYLISQAVTVTPGTNVKRILTRLDKSLNPPRLRYVPGHDGRVRLVEDVDVTTPEYAVERQCREGQSFLADLGRASILTTQTLATTTTTKTAPVHLRLRTGVRVCGV